MVTFLIVLMMMCNLWILFYLTWEQQERQKAGSQENTDRKRQDPPPDVGGRSKSKIWDWIGKEKDTTVPEAATSVEAEAVEEKDVTFADETDTDGGQAPENKPSRQVPDDELDETFSDSRVSDMAEYDGNEDYDGEPHEASGFTFEDIDLAMRTVKKPAATMEERRHAGMVFCDMKGNELFAMIEKSSEATRRKLNELMDFYMDSVSATIRKEPTPTAVRTTVPNVPDNIEDFNIRDFV